MHVLLRYGKEYIGSKTPVLIENEHPSYTEAMVAIKYSEFIHYRGHLVRLANFLNAVAHRIEVVECSNDTTLSQLCGFFKAKEKMDCCFFLNKVENMREEVVSGLTQLRKNSALDLQDILITTSNTSQFFSPIFIGMAPTLGNTLSSARMKFRTIALATPQASSLSAYIELSLKKDQRIAAILCDKFDSLN